MYIIINNDLPPVVAAVASVADTFEDELFCPTELEYFQAWNSFAQVHSGSYLPHSHYSSHSVVKFEKKIALYQQKLIPPEKTHDMALLDSM